jgi:hypothetical protein
MPGHGIPGPLFSHQVCRCLAFEILFTVSQSFASGGKRVGPCEICTLIGEGGMSHVYSARRADRAYSQNVALKFMRADFGRDREMLVRFRVERQILANLKPPECGPPLRWRRDA